MMLATAATGIGKQVVTHAVRTWFGARQERTQRDAELVDLVRIGVRDHFKQRKLVRQLEDLADQIAERLRPVYEHDFRSVAEGERSAALQAVVDALEAADLTDATLFAVDVDARKLARLVRERVPVRRVGLAEPAEQLYNAVLDESCMALVQVVKHLPAFEPRALAELLDRFSQVKDDIAEVLHRLPRTTLDAPRGSEHDEEFRARYLTHLSETLDELEQFGVDVRRYKPRTLVSVAYLSLQVSTDRNRRGRGDRPDEHWFTEGRRTVPGSSSLRAEAALAESPRTLLRGDAGSGKTTLLHGWSCCCDIYSRSAQEPCRVVGTYSHVARCARWKDTGAHRTRQLPGHRLGAIRHDAVFDTRIVTRPPPPGPSPPGPRVAGLAAAPS